tara:strand:- start:241 stop:684 length:444 start_codon:yes stop_codon:yes gene_type:complete
MGVNTSNSNHEDNFENIETDKEYEATLGQHFNDVDVNDVDETKTCDKESKSDGDDQVEEVHCIMLDDEPIFYIQDKTDKEIKSVLQNYAKRICSRAKRHYTDLNFYIDEAMEDSGEIIVNITTLQKFILFTYDNLYCSLRSKKICKM